MDSKELKGLYDEKEVTPPKAIELMAGPVSVLFQPETGFLRYLRVGDHEIVRGIYGAVRDSNWNTIEPRICNLKSDVRSNEFEITFDADCKRGGIHFVWRGHLLGEASGRISFEFKGKSITSFDRNRIGLCVLHPITECAGRACAIEHANGQVEQSFFPKSISPHQPFSEIRSLTYQPAPNTNVKVDFEGEVFEMEDQRNWTDASFKTYGTPLAWPFPVNISAGTEIFQTVVVQLIEPTRKILPILMGRDPQLSISTTTTLAFPPLGLSCHNPGYNLSITDVHRLRKLSLAHLRTDLHLNAPDWQEHFHHAVSIANQIAVSLHVAVYLDENYEDQLAFVKGVCSQHKALIALWIILSESHIPPTVSVLHHAVNALGQINPKALFATGTGANFAELNRHRFPGDLLMLPCYPLNPQVHATDNWSMVETLGAQPQTVETLKQFLPRSAVISPITLKPRCNPYLTSVSKSSCVESPSEEESDPRQTSLFCAGWTLGSMSRLCATGNLHSLTYYQTVGLGGLMMGTDQRIPKLPERCFPGAVYPVYFLLLDLVGFSRFRPTHSSHPLQVEGMTLLDAKGKTRILVANLTDDLQAIRIKTGTCRALMRILDESNLELNMRQPEMLGSLAHQSLTASSGKVGIELPPFSIATIDLLA